MQTTDPNHSHVLDASPQLPVNAEKLLGIRHIIAVGCGKRGVGKSTVNVNLALALQQARDASMTSAQVFIECCTA